MVNPEITNNVLKNEKIPVWKNAPFWHITILMAVLSVFYYMDVIIDYTGWVNLKRDIFYTVHDLHRALFLIPVMYATYEFRLKGIIVSGFLSLLVFLPRALIVSSYPDPLLRALIFTIAMIIMGVFLSLLLNSITRRKELEQNLSLAQDDLLRQQAREALRESEDKYKSLIDNIPDIIFTIDLEGKITFVSKRTKEILGYENTETINMNILNFIPEEDRQRAMENLQKGMQGEPIKHFPIPMIAKSGERLIFECSFTRVYKNGAVIGAQGTAVDITERKHAESQREASLKEIERLNAVLENKVAQRTRDLRDNQLALLNIVEDLNNSNKQVAVVNQSLDAINKELETFSYSVSHDLRAPLRSVDAYAKMIQEDYAERLDDEGRRLLQVIRDSAHDMGQLISDLLAFSRLSRKGLQMGRVGMRELFTKARLQFEQAETGRAIRWDIGEMPPAFGDEAMIREALINLLANAVKYTRPRQDAAIGISGRVDGDDVVYSVTDNGVGFDMAYKDKLFCVFQRLHSNAEFEGTGIGLALVQRIVQRHGGRVWAEGKVNEGATFYFSLPGKANEE